MHIVRHCLANQSANLSGGCGLLRAKRCRWRGRFELLVVLGGGAIGGAAIGGAAIVGGYIETSS